MNKLINGLMVKILPISNVIKDIFFSKIQKFSRAALAPHVCVLPPNKRVMSGKFADVK